MPQMAPIWWSTLFMTMIITYTIVMALMYFYKIYKLEIKIKNQEKMIMNINWKW